jgi:glycogen(starch) synthase
MTVDKLGVLMLSWEFPPRIIGGISSHVNDLSIALRRKDIAVHVVTCDFPGAPEREQIKGVNVYRFNSKIPSPSFLGWVFSMNQAMTEKAIDVFNEHDEEIDIIHAHDWLVTEAAVRIRDAFSKPLVSTIHATELGRRNGIHNDYQRTINEIERRLIDQSYEVICCSNYMANQISEAFNIRKSRLNVIPNGVDAAKFNAKRIAQSVRQRFAKRGEKIISFVGRLVHEKGVHVLIGAIPKVLAVMPNVNFVIVGEGGMKEYLMKEAWDFGVADHVFFTGFIDCATLISIYRASDVAVFPSLYEPFGITALEAMAARTPIVVTDTGGLAEIVEHEKTGIKVYVDNSDSLAWGILRILQDPDAANRMRENAYAKIIRDHDWNRIAEKTIIVYNRALKAKPKPQAVRMKLPFLEFEEYPEEMRVLLLMHLLGAADDENAKRASEMADMLGITVSKLNSLLQKLADSGYVMFYRDSLRRLRYFLTKQGIVKILSAFS